MESGELLVAVHIPSRMRQALGEHYVQRLRDAHPRARVEIADTLDELAALLPHADGALIPSGAGPLLTPALQPGRRLRWVHSLAAGVNAVLTPELVAARHVAITASKGPMGPLMAEHVVALTLALARDLPTLVRRQDERRWQYVSDDQPMLDLFERTIAILGVGAVGGHLARICKAGFGMRVLGLARTRRDSPYVDRYFEREALHDALGEADVVALTLSLTPATRHIIDAAALAAMKPTALLINVARGELVDEAAMIDALRERRIGGAGLDTVTTEPLPADSPLWTLPNVLITPHMAPGRDRFGADLVAFWSENIRRFAEGEPLLAPVDRDAGY